jgi:hypothetical protein
MALPKEAVSRLPVDRQPSVSFDISHISLLTVHGRCSLAFSAITAFPALLFNVVTQPSQDLRPAFVYFASSWGQTGVG